MSGFSFAFSGDDIEDASMSDQVPEPLRSHAAETGSLRRAPTPAFPIAGQALLAPQSHDLKSMLELLPSKICYSSLAVTLDDGSQISIPRRELWDVRVQLMAEEDDESLANLRNDDVRTGVYEGGFKSWESSVDVLKVLQGRREDAPKLPKRVLEVCLAELFGSMKHANITLARLWNCTSIDGSVSMESRKRFIPKPRLGLGTRRLQPNGPSTCHSAKSASFLGSSS